MEFLRKIFSKKRKRLEETEDKKPYIYAKDYWGHTVKRKCLYLTEFKNGYASAIIINEKNTCKFIVVNKKYEEVLSSCYVYCIEDGKNAKVEWHNGYIAVLDLKANVDYIFLNSDLEVIPGHQYSRVFWDPKANGCIEVEVENKHGLLDENLNVILEPEYDIIKYSGENEIFTLKIEETISEIITYQDNKITKKQVKGIILEEHNYQDRIYYKFKIDNKYGYYNENLEIAIPTEYDLLGKIDSNGLIPFEKNGKMGVADIITGMETYR